jgi:hydroxymethylpyrimidine/phosphomethylpyrimidine kinase
MWPHYSITVVEARASGILVALMPKLSRSKVASMSCVLSIAGLDPGGGAGIIADARGIMRAGAFPTAVAAVLTVQSTSGLRDVRPVPSKLVMRQARAVFANQNVRAVKIGALGGAANVNAVAELAAIHKDIPFIVDPVMRPTRGSSRLLDDGAIRALRKELLPRAALVTANVPEAEVLVKRRIVTVHDARIAVEALAGIAHGAALLKGGHMASGSATDFLFANGELYELTSPRLTMPQLHGGGCVLSSLIAGRLAADERAWADESADMLLEATRWSKRTHHRALASLYDVGGDLRVMNP